MCEAFFGDKKMRNIEFLTDFTKNPYSSVLISCGNTKVLATVSIEEKVPGYVDKNEGWLTAEYNLIPASTLTRKARERKGVGGRTAEIQRLIGRSLRMAVDRKLFPGITMTVDAEVLQADGGTRTASINGGMVALYLAGKRLVAEKKCEKNPLIRWIGAISAGIINNDVVVDLDYEKDSIAETDMNFVFDEHGAIIEVQGTAEKEPLTDSQFIDLLSQSKLAVADIITEMKKVVSK